MAHTGKDDLGSSDGFLPLSTPRRRLGDALRMEAVITAKLEKLG